MTDAERFAVLVGKFKAEMVKRGFRPAVVEGAAANRAVCAAMIEDSDQPTARAALQTLLKMHDAQAALRRGEKLAFAAAIIEGTNALSRLALAGDAAEREHNRRIRTAQSAAAARVNTTKKAKAAGSRVACRRAFTEIRTRNPGMSNESICALVAQRLQISTKTVRRHVFKNPDTR